MQAIPAVRFIRLQANLVGVETIHQRIKRLREAKGLSQEALGKAVGVKYQSVQEWERKMGTAPSRKRLAMVANALGVTEQYLLSGDHPAFVGARQPVAGYESISARALEVARRFDTLLPACQNHVSAQVDLLARVQSSNGDFERAAENDMVIKSGKVQAPLSQGKKINRKS